MRRIRIVNPLLDETFKTYLSTDYSSGTALEVLNTNSFAVDDILVVGEPTEELTEAKDVDAVADKDTLTLPAGGLNFAHGKGTPVYKSPWDQVSIEGRSSSAGTFAQLVLTNIQWDNKQKETVYYHSSGSDSWEYRFRFYNSITTTYSEYSPTLTGQGFNRNQVGYMLREVKKLANLTNQTVVTDYEIIRQFNKAQDIIYAHNPRYWFLLVDSYKQNTGISSVGGQSVYDLDVYSNFGHLESLRAHYNNGGTSKIYHLEKKSAVEFDHLISDLSASDNDWTEMYKLLPADSSSDIGYFQVDPVPQTTGITKFYPNYYEKMQDLDDISDETQVPYPSMLEEYALGYVYRVKGDDVKAKSYEAGLISDNEDRVPRDLLVLDKMDKQQKMAQGQPRNLSTFKGQKAFQRFYRGGRFKNRDYIKLNYIDDL